MTLVNMALFEFLAREGNGEPSPWELRAKLRSSDGCESVHKLMTRSSLVDEDNLDEQEFGKY
jgi:hypothetical protein